MGSECLMRPEYQFSKTERVLEVDGGDSCTARRAYLLPMNGVLKNG